MTALLALVGLALAQAAPAPPSRGELDALRAQSARSASAAAQAQALAAQTAQRAAALEQRLAQLEQRGQAIEDNRVERAAEYAQASDVIRGAQQVLMGGSTEVASELAVAERALVFCSEGAARFGGEQEQADVLAALEAIAAARGALVDGDLYQARLQLVQSAEVSGLAMSAAQTAVEPLFRP